jgi:hypothetical protein
MVPSEKAKILVFGESGKAKAEPESSRECRVAKIDEKRVKLAGQGP